MSRLREHVEGLCVDEFVAAFGEALYVPGQRCGIAGNVDDPFGRYFQERSDDFFVAAGARRVEHHGPVVFFGKLGRGLFDARGERRDFFFIPLASALHAMYFAAGSQLSTAVIFAPPAAKKAVMPPTPA